MKEEICVFGAYSEPLEVIVILATQAADEEYGAEAEVHDPELPRGHHRPGDLRKSAATVEFSEMKEFTK